MPLILVAEQEGRYVERVRDALTSEGWRVRVAASSHEALAAAAAEPPQLVLVSSELAEAGTLFTTFSRKSGGPGVVALVAEDGTGSDAARHGADEAVEKPFTDQEIRLAVRRGLAPPAAAAPPQPDSGDTKSPQLTSEDIFGDLVAEVESELSFGQAPAAAPAAAGSAATSTAAARSAAEQGPASAAPAAAGRDASGGTRAGRRSHEIDRALEQTLSGLRDGEESRRRKARTVKRRSSDDKEVEALLSETLSGLDLSQGRPRRKAPPTPSSGAGAAPQGPAPRETPPAPSQPAPASPPAASPPPVSSRREIDFSELESLIRNSPGERPGERAAPPPAAASPGSAPALETPAPEAKPVSSVPSAPSVGPSAEPSTGIPEPAPAEPARETPPDAAPAAAPVPPETLRFGQYTLLERIAIGGMAEVWKARMTGVEGFQKTVAIKKILPHLTDNDDFVNMFIDEAKLAAQLSHPNIIHIYDLGKIGDHYYIAMEYVEGKNLRNLLNESQKKALPIPRGLALLITARLASALDYAHRKKDFEDRELGLVHRDVSPQNVLLSNEGDIKLCDFGIVKAVSKASQTQMGALKGKLQYMSPEQAWGKPVDARSDIFSLGSLLFEMLTGERLFAGDSEISVLEAVRQCRIRAPRDLDPRIPEDVERAVLKALEQDPDRRFPTAGQMQHDLEEILYALRPAPSQADLADYLQRLAETEEAPAQTAGAGERAAPSAASAEAALEAPAEPAALLGEIDLGAAIPETAAPTAAAPEPLAAPPAEEPPEVEALTALGDEELEVEEGGSRGKRLLLVVILLLLVAGAAAGYWLWARGSFQDLFQGGPGGSEAPPTAEEGTETPAPAAVEGAAEGEEGAGEAPGQTAPETAPDGGASSSGSAAEPAPAPGTAGARRSGAAGAAPTAPSTGDLEAAVSQAVARREKALRRELEQQEKDLERKLAEAERGGNGAAAVPEPPPKAPGSSNPAAGAGPSAAPEAATEAATSPSENGPETGAEPESAAGVPEGAQPGPAAAAAPSAQKTGEEAASAAASRQPSPPPTSPPSAPGRSGASPATSAASSPASQTKAPAEPAPKPPAEPRVREGDLVGPGPGAEPPVLVTFEKPQYPPMARRLRVEGEVILSILVDETGNVIETHVAKGVRQAVGINEAAIEAARGAQFRPATKNGVRVKMWTTLRIPFKL